MKFNLPHLEWDLDCEAFGYPGIVFKFWLNAPEDPPTTPAWLAIEDPVAQNEARKAAPEWDIMFYHSMVHFMDSLTIPQAYIEGATEDKVIEFKSAGDLFDFENSGGFDKQLLLWAWRQYAAQRHERLKIELKN